MQWKDAGVKFPHRQPAIRSPSMTMTQQFAVAARDQSEAGLEQAHGGEPLRRRLPVIALHGSEPEDRLGDLLLARAVTMSVDGLQHAPRASQLLSGKAGVRWNHAAVEGGQQPRDGLDAIKAVGAERNHRHKWLAGRSVGGKHQVQAFSVSQIMKDVKVVFGTANFRRFGDREQVPGNCKGRRRRR